MAVPEHPLAYDALTDRAAKRFAAMKVAHGLEAATLDGLGRQGEDLKRQKGELRGLMAHHEADAARLGVAPSAETITAYQREIDALDVALYANADAKQKARDANVGHVLDETQRGFNFAVSDEAAKNRSKAARGEKPPVRPFPDVEDDFEDHLEDGEDAATAAGRFVKGCEKLIAEAALVKRGMPPMDVAIEQALKPFRVAADANLLNIRKSPKGGIVAGFARAMLAGVESNTGTMPTVIDVERGLARLLLPVVEAELRAGAKRIYAAAEAEGVPVLTEAEKRERLADLAEDIDILSYRAASATWAARESGVELGFWKGLKWFHVLGVHPKAEPVPGQQEHAY